MIADHSTVPEITVFISYSHDSEAHREQVLRLSERLRLDGVTTILDRYVGGSPPEGWPRWMTDGLDAATHVVCVCTETYHRRFRGHEVPDKGKGVDWEGALVTQALYDARSSSSKFIPVLFPGADESHIPAPLRPQTHYRLDSEASYQALYDCLLNQAGVQPGPVGKLKSKARPTGQPLAFADAPDGKPFATPAEFKVDVSRIDKYTPDELIGRTAEIRLLDEAWGKAQRNEASRSHVLSLVALGGEGKTSLVSKWVAALAHQGWPGCTAVFAWSFYSQGTREQTASSSELFLNEALRFFGDPALAASAQGGIEKARRLAQLVGAQRTLLILDGVEPLQYAPTSPTPGQLRDAALSTLLKALAASSQGLCVLTTRYSITDLKAHRQCNAPEYELQRLSTEAGVALLQKLGVRKESGSKQEFRTLVDDVQGHALTLNLLGGFLTRAFKGDIRQRHRVRFDKADDKIQGGHAFRAMAAYEEWLLQGGDEGRREVAILRLMGLFDRPADAGCIDALRKEPIAGLNEALVGIEDDDWEFSLTGLEGAKLLTVGCDTAGGLRALDAHPLLREYFARQLRETLPEAWRAAHRRLYEHLCVSTQEGELPSLEDLQPLYQAVAHGCLAGLQQEACDEVYYARIQRGKEAYSTRKLGAFAADLGAVACFFEIPWRSVSSVLLEDVQCWLLHQAAHRLRALGQPSEALAPMRESGEMDVKVAEWEGAAISYGSLSELALTLGDVAGALHDAEQAVNYAERSGKWRRQLACRTIHADALHQAGRRAEAQTHFAETEALQAKRQPTYPLLYSVQGFQYCDLLLAAAAERAAWQSLQGVGADSLRAEAKQVCRAVATRAAQSLQWAQQNDAQLLTFALEHVTLGRAAL